MGLDISAYSGLVNVTIFEKDEDGYPLGEYVDFYKAHGWDNPDRFDGLKESTMYSFTSELFGPSMSYSGYSIWRETLARIAGYPIGVTSGIFGNFNEYPHCDAAAGIGHGPFYEQIVFSDCDGAIGSVVSTKLAKDYDDFAVTAGKIGGHFWEYYQQFHRAFKLASNNGAVVFR